MSGNGENHNKKKIGREDVTAEAEAMQSFHFGAPPASVSTEAEEYNTNIGPPPQAFAPEPLEPVEPYPTAFPMTMDNSGLEQTMLTEVLEMPDDGGLEYVDMPGMERVHGVDTLAAPHHVPEVSFNGMDYHHTQADLHEYNEGETVPAPPRPSIVILDRASIAGLQHRPSVVSESAPGAPVESNKIMLVQEPVPPRRISLDLPVHYEMARHSIDIVRRDQDPKEVHKPNKNLVAKARKRAIDISEHEMPISELCAKYETRYDEATETPIGLSETVAKERLRVNGPNAIKPPKKTPGIVKFLKELTSLFSLMLMVAGLLTFLTLAFDTSSYTDTIILGSVLFVIAFVNSLITYLEERKNEKILAGFSQLAAKQTKVFRDGLIREIDVKELVVGDIVRINAGDKIPADLRVLKSNGVKVDNSSLTGEGDPLLRTKENTHKNPLETHNLMFYGTLAVEGEGYAMVIRTANDTVIGQIANLATNTAKQDTPLRQEINHFVKTIGLIAVLMAIVFFCIGFGMGNPTQLNIIFAIGIICANIPQGLIAIVSLALTISAKRLAARNVLVKSLESVETLGSTTCICSDKTGTLTQNRMTVVDLWYDDSLRSAATSTAPVKKGGKLGAITQKTANAPESTTAQLYDEGNMSTLQMLQRACILCNRTIFDPSAENLALPIVKQKTIGDASETALLKYYATRPNYPSTAAIRAMYPKLFEIPFNSTIKFQLSVHKLTMPKGAGAPVVDEDNYPRLLLIKGAPERIIKKCSKIMIDGKEVDMDEGHLARFEEAYETLAGRGERVLGFAQMYLTPANGFPKEMDTQYGPQNVPQEDGFTFIGLTGLQDPPKPGVFEAIQKCKTAGIQVVMVTGDHQLTAKAIAKQIRIIEDKTPEDIAAEKCVNVSDLGDYFDISPAIVLNGEQLETLSDEQWAKILKKKQIVFARTSPQQKLLIVDKFQSIGHIVGVTGDGVNDSPALKKANIGISMGITGSDVSKEAASLILLDDNFASIVNGIEEGRVIFDNLKKSVTYTLTHIVPEIIPFIVNVVFKIPLPLPALLLLMIDIGTDLFSAVSMAYEKAESDILLRKPRSKDDRLITWQIMSYAYFQVGIIETLGCLFAYFVTFGYYGIPAWALYHSTITYFKPGAPNLVIPHSQNIFYNFLPRHQGTLTGTWTPSAMVFTAADQIAIMQRAQSAYFVALVIQQIANMFATKTRINSLVMQGIWNNKMMIIGPIWGIVITVILLYVPGINNVIFHTYPIDFVLWLPSLAYFVLILWFSEMTKLAIRHSSKGNFLLW